MKINISEEQRKGILVILKDQRNRWSGKVTIKYKGCNDTKNFNIQMIDIVIKKFEKKEGGITWK